MALNQACPIMHSSRKFMHGKLRFALSNGNTPEARERRILEAQRERECDVIAEDGERERERARGTRRRKNEQRHHLR